MGLPITPLGDRVYQRLTADCRLRNIDYTIQTMQPKITIIIPVYNVEKYLRQCLDSVVNQTMREIQIICVNDGSRDNSRTILQEYADRDARVAIIDQHNSGKSAARNAAYPHIKGKYTLFVDSDDWLELDLCEKTYQKSEATGATLTFFFYQGENGQSDPSYRRITPTDKTTAEEKKPLLFWGVVWDKLWRTDFLLSNKLYFPEGLEFEDTFVNWQAITLAGKMSIVPERFYHYRRTPGSAMQARWTYWRDAISIYNKIRDHLLESGHYAVYRDYFVPKKMRIWHQHYRSLSTSDRRQFAAMIRESLSEDDREFYRNASKKQVPNVLKLFYEMIDGDKTAALNYQVSLIVHETVRMPERFIRQWIVKPLQRRLRAA